MTLPGPNTVNPNSTSIYQKISESMKSGYQAFKEIQICQLIGKVTRAVVDFFKPVYQAAKEKCYSCYDWCSHKISSYRRPSSPATDMVKVNKEDVEPPKEDPKPEAQQWGIWYVITNYFNPFAWFSK